MNKIVGEQLYQLYRKLSATAPEQVSPPLLDELDRICATPYELDEELFYIYKSATEKAARLACEIVGSRPFPDHNDATAMLAMLTLLELNGQGVTRYREDLMELKMWIADGDYAQCCRWIADHSIPRWAETE